MKMIIPIMFSCLAFLLTSSVGVQEQDRSGKGDGPSVVGSYFRGNRGRVNETLSLSADGSATFRGTGDGRVVIKEGDEHAPIGDTIGSWSIDLDIVRLAFPREAISTLSGKPLLNLCQVMAGGRLYLVEEAGFLSFCQAINAGDEPRNGKWGKFFLRESDWDIVGSINKAELPRVWQRYVLDKPISGTVLAESVAGGQSIDLGEVDGVFEGMNLFWRWQRSEVDIDHVPLVVNRVTTKTCDAEYKYGNESDFYPKTIPAGSVITSRVNYVRSVDEGPKERR